MRGMISLLPMQKAKSLEMTSFAEVLSAWAWAPHLLSVWFILNLTEKCLYQDRSICFMFSRLACVHFEVITFTFQRFHNDSRLPTVMSSARCSEFRLVKVAVTCCRQWVSHLASSLHAKEKCEQQQKRCIYVICNNHLILEASLSWYLLLNIFLKYGYTTYDDAMTNSDLRRAFCKTMAGLRLHPAQKYREI